MSIEPIKNKETAQAFYDLMFNQCKPREAIEKYVGDEYIQHNPEERLPLIDWNSIVRASDY